MLRHVRVGLNLEATPDPLFRLLTYNVHRCLGIDGILSPERIASVIASARPDIVCLQEVDSRRLRSGLVDQPGVIARKLAMHFHFHPAMRVLEEEYGNAILTAEPARLIKAQALPGLANRPGLEPRGAIWVELVLGGQRVQVVNTHLGLRGPERLKQIEHLAGPQFLGAQACRAPVIVAGDFNAPRRSRAYARMTSCLADAESFVTTRPEATYPARFPLVRVDHVFVSQGVHVQRVTTIRSGEARLASDHLPLVVDFTLATASGSKARPVAFGSDPEDR